MCFSTTVILSLFSLLVYNNIDFKSFYSPTVKLFLSISDNLRPLASQVKPPVLTAQVIFTCLACTTALLIPPLQHLFKDLWYFFFCSNERNVIEAAAKGASTAIALVANIAANLIAFLAFLAFFNGALSWIGSMVGHPELSFEVLVNQ